MSTPNPIVPGFNPDPSIVLVDGVYYLVTSTFEWFPGLPVYRSTDLLSWDLIGHVADRDEQLRLRGLDAEGGVFAPTIRFHDGLFHVITTVAGSRGNVVFTAADPAGPWSDGVELPGIVGIDPDLAWDADGQAYVTYAGASFEDGRLTTLGIVQRPVDLSTGECLGPVRSLWSGTGLKFPEGPHLHEIDGRWYLMLAEGGTERGHAVSVARGDSPVGPFEGCPSNPVLTAAGSDAPVQNTGHADIVRTPDGGWAMVCLGVRTGGVSQRFGPIGRETFLTPLRWHEGWPVVEPVAATAQTPAHEAYDADHHLDGSWIAPRRPWAEFTSTTARPGWLRLDGPGASEGGLDARDAAFLGRRQRHLTCDVTARVDASQAAGSRGGLALRSDEDHHVSITTDAHGHVVARARLRGLEQTWHADVDGPVVDLTIRFGPAGTLIPASGKGSDVITLLAAGTDGRPAVVAEVDGRYWAMEVASHMTGRVVGLLAESGSLDVESFTYDGR